MGGVVIAPSARGGTIENYENLVFTMMMVMMMMMVMRMRMMVTVCMRAATEPHCRADGPIVRFDFNQFHFISDHDDAGDHDDRDVFMFLRCFKL